MKRRHSREDAIALCKTLRAARPNIAFGADIIAGFPTETDAQFENSLSIISEIGIAFAHIFPFSAKAGTPAAKMPQVGGPVIKARAKALREAAERARQAHFARRLGESGLALVEKDGFARLPDFTPVTFTPCGAVNGELRTVALTGYDSQHMQGTLSE
jgi:threonylcarbamoyladenosine tRNA methylthiotransferase MtaB